MEKSAEVNPREKSKGDAESGGCCCWKLCWWNPPQDSLDSESISESSLHGLKYIGQPKRHITERIFWFLAFVIGVVAAGLLINAMVRRYENTPVIVSFKSKEQLIETIPFPAVTFCNINQFSKKKVQEFERIASLPTHKEYEIAKRNLSLVRSFCQSKKSLTQIAKFAVNRGHPKLFNSSNNDEKIQDDMVDFLIENTLPCDQMVRFCMFEAIASNNCSDILVPVITEFGKCCTCNMLPLPLLLKNPSKAGKKNSSLLDDPVLRTRLKQNDFGIKEWSKWNYDKGFILPPPNYRTTQPKDFFPVRQNGPGKAHGFSVLLDPVTDDYFCPMSDAEGILFTLHSAVELPNVKEFPSVIDTNKEVYIKIFPEITFADNDTRALKSEKRECYFGKEKKLKLFKPYTRENCMDDCAADYILKKCHCGLFYMPRFEGVKVCNIDAFSKDGICVLFARGDLRANKSQLCGDCLALCEDIEYRFETTTVTLKNTTHIRNDIDPSHEDKLPEWANHKMSIVHMYFGTPAVVPKLRKRSYGDTDLIANAGGILGLCLGFSVLGAAEVVYFVLVKVLWKYCHRRQVYGHGLCRRSRKQTPASASITLEHQEIKPAPIFMIPASFNHASAQ